MPSPRRVRALYIDGHRLSVRLCVCVCVCVCLYVCMSVSLTVCPVRDPKSRMESGRTQQAENCQGGSPRYGATRDPVREVKVKVKVITSRRRAD